MYAYIVRIQYIHILCIYALYYALEFNIILNLTSPVKVYVIWIIYSYDFIIIYIC